MTKREIVQALMELSIAERLVVMEDLLHSIRSEYTTENLGDHVIKGQVLNAVQLMKEDYSTDSEFTAFKVLDGDDFHGEG